MDNSEASDRSFKERWLILEWSGRWDIPDHWHGGIWAGPYTSKALAEEAVVNHAELEAEGSDEYDKKSYISRHIVISVYWPVP